MSKFCEAYGGMGSISDTIHFNQTLLDLELDLLGFYDIEDFDVLNFVYFCITNKMRMLYEYKLSTLPAPEPDEDLPY